MALLDPPERL
jgi:hypothetical protein